MAESTILLNSLWSDKIIYGHNNYVKHWYRSDNAFTFDYMEYEYDDLTNRYYILHPSENMSDPNMDGALVKHRISKSSYFEKLTSLKQSLESL